jgi:Fe-S-cluster containining protein
MTDESQPVDHPVPAGAFSEWLEGARRALREDATSVVPCGDCVACCTSSQFVHVAPDEVATLARIPAALRFPAPRLRAGHVVLGYDERGHCPMLIDGACTIYDDRPRACRTYDCRIFAAAGVEPDDDKPAIARRARRWRFAYPTDQDRLDQEAVRAAAQFVREHPDARTEGDTPTNATRHAVLAVTISDGRMPGETTRDRRRGP